MAQLPPPVHGAALRNKSLLESQHINAGFELSPLPLKYIDNMNELGKFSLRKIFRMMQQAIKMATIFFTRRIDLVYFTMSPSGGAFYRDILFITIIKLFRKKRLLHFRIKGIKHTGRSRLGKALIKYAFRGSNIICLSNHHLQDLAGFTDRPPYIVPNGIRTETEFLHLADEYSPDPSQPSKILFLSNLSRKKGVPELIEALYILKTSGYNFTAALVGSEWDMSFEDVKQLICAKGLEDMVKITGPKFGEEKFKYIAEADIFAFPTYFDLFPGVILEAMQFGKAIVTTYEGSIPEIIDNGVNGVLVEPKNASALASGISFLIDNPSKREKMRHSAREKFFSQFTLAAFEQNMYSVLDEVINDKAGP